MWWGKAFKEKVGAAESRRTQTCISSEACADWSSGGVHLENLCPVHLPLYLTPTRTADQIDPFQARDSHQEQTDSAFSRFIPP